MTEILPVRFWS